MKQVLALLFVFLLGCSSEIKTAEQSLSLKSYNLKGNVEYFSDKRIPSILTKEWETKSDSSSLISIQNKYFDKNGLLINLKYFDKDSVLILKSEIKKSKTGKYQGSMDFDKNGKQTKFTKIVSSTKDNMETETYDPKSGDLISKSKTEYENYLVKKQKSKFIAKGHRCEYIYTRDNEGNEIEILMIIQFGNKKIENKSFVKYVDFDKYGNWTKRIDYNKKKGEECLLTVRKIRYYE